MTTTSQGVLQLHEFFSTLPEPVMGFLILGGFICLGLQLFLNQAVLWIGAREAIVIQKKWAEKLYRSILRTPVFQKNQVPLGELVTTYTTDIPGATILLEQSIPQGASIAFPFLLVPLFLHVVYGLDWSSMVLTLVAITLLNLFLAHRQSRFFYLFKSLASERVSLVVQWVQNIKILRVLGWTEAYEALIFNKREVETQNRIGMLTNGQTMNAIAASVSFALNVAVLASVFVLKGVALTPGAVFTILWVVAVFLTRPFRQLPWFFTFIFDSWTSMQRVSAVLEKMVDPDEPLQTEPRVKMSLDRHPEAPAILLQNLSLEHKGKTILDRVSLQVDRGEHIGVVGDVGSGKSMLFLSLLLEAGATFDRYEIFGESVQDVGEDAVRSQFAYVPQEGFIMNASLRENLWLDYGVAQDRDDEIMQILSRVELDFEKEKFPEGLATLFGERGVNLSGGQRQRMSLARVEFFNRPILLLDDVLSAIDQRTEKSLLHNLFHQLWRDRTVILATHRLSVLPFLDRVFFMHQGRIQDSGHFDDLVQRNPEFRAFVEHKEKTREAAPS